MKKIIGFSTATPLVGAVLCAFLFSFTLLPGVHSVRVYLDNKLVIDQYLNSKTASATLALDPAENYNKLIVKYSECGRKVTGRMITIKDNAGKTLKEFRFDGSSTGFEGSMTCNVKDILALKQKGSNSLKLFYSSADFPEGQQIANIVVGTDAKAMN